MMAFGLYVDPIVVSQRHTLYDSDEEEEDNETEVSITVSDAKQPVTEGGMLLVAVGVTASIFAQSYPILEDGPTCSILTDSQTVFKGRYFPSRAGTEPPGSGKSDSVHLSEVYAVKSDSSRDKANCYVCVHEQLLKPEYCNSWASKIFDTSRPSTVIILTSRASQEHFSPHVVKSDPCCMLRCLQSSSWSCTPLTPIFLEPPNTVDGEAAAIMTHCQVNKIQAAMAVLYADSTVSTTESMSALQPVLKHPLLSESLLLNPIREALQKAKGLAPKPRHDLSTLYT